MATMNIDEFAVFSSSDEYRRCCRQCIIFAKSYTYDTAQAECMAEEAMVILWKRMQKGERIERLMPFLFTTVRNLALNYLKHKQADIRAREGMGSDRDREIQLRLCSLNECNPSKLYQADIQEIIDDTLKHLGERTETIFRLSRFEGITNREIAAELGISEKTVEYHMSKALKELRVSLEDYLPMLLFFNLYHLVG